MAGLIAGAIGIASVLLLYMLKLRRRPVSVSSTMLWSRAVKDMEGNVPWQRLSPTLLLWLHLLIVILLALAIARPVFDHAMGDGQRVYLVIDTSVSMNAVVDGRSGLEIAKEQAVDRARVLFDSGRSPRVSLISSALEPRVILADSSERGRIIGAIRAIEPTDQPGDLADAVALIESMHESGMVDDDVDGSEVAGEVSAGAVWVFSDGGSLNADQIPMRGGGGMSVSPFDRSSAMGNLGLIAIGASRDRADPGICRLFVRVDRNADGPIAAVIRIFEDDSAITSRAVAFEENEETISESFEIRLMQGALLRVELDVDDALDVDDRAWVAVPDPSPVRITVVAPEGIADPLLVDMLEVISRTRVGVIGGDEPIIDADLVVFDRVSPTTLPDVATIGFASIFPEQSRSDLLEELGSRSRMISWDRSDAVVRDAGVGSVSYQRSVMFPEVDGDSGMRVLARDRRGALIVERSSGLHRHLRVGFALHDSNWAVQVGMPIFLVNAIERLLPGTSGVGEVFTTSDVVWMDGADGRRVSVGPIDRAGVIEIEGRRIGLGVLDRQESALDVRTDIEIGSGDLSKSQRVGGPTQRELWRWFSLLAILLIAIEWFAYGARVKII